MVGGLFFTKFNHGRIVQYKINNVTCYSLLVCLAALQTASNLIKSVSDPFPPTPLRRCHAQTGKDSFSSYKIDYVIVIKNFLNPEGHQHPISGSKVTAILLKGLIWPIGGAASGRVCACSLRNRLVLIVAT